MKQITGRLKTDKVLFYTMDVNFWYLLPQAVAETENY